MKLTNRNSHPDTLYQAVLNDPYDKGDAAFSVSELPQPPRLAALRQKHWEELEEDVEERLWAFYGQLGHELLRRANRWAIAEKRYFGVIARTPISGQVDNLELDNGGTLTDWKFVSVRNFKDGSVRQDWIAQLNMLLELLRQNGGDARRLQIVGLIRDFSRIEAGWNPYYPKTPVVRQLVPLWPRETTRRYMKERILLHQEARVTLPECTPEERWAEPDEYAVMERGRKSAVSRYTRRDLADSHAKKNSSFYVIRRPGRNIRCDNFCPVRKFCSQYASLSKMNLRRPGSNGPEPRHLEGPPGKPAAASESRGVECPV